MTWLAWLVIRALSWVGWAGVQIRRGVDQVVEEWNNLR